MGTQDDAFWAWMRAALDDETEDERGVRLGSTQATSLGALQLAFDAGAEWGAEWEAARSSRDE